MDYISKKLNYLNIILNRKNLNLNEIKNTMDLLSETPVITSEDYLNTLLHPATFKGSRIPTNIPIPTCSFSVTWTESFKVGNEGAICSYLNPWFLNIDCTGKSYIYDLLWQNGRWYKYKVFLKNQTNFIYFKPNLSGNKEMPINSVPSVYAIGHKISDVYSKYRLVSGELKIIPSETLLNTRGIIGGGILIGGPNIIGAQYYSTEDLNAEYNPRSTFYNTTAPDLVKFTNFENIRNLPCHKEANVYEGLRMLYFPAGKEYEEFTDIYNGKGTRVDDNDIRYQSNPEVRVNQDYTKTNFAWLFYIQNGNPSKTKVMVTLTCNYECIPKPEYLDYFDVQKCYSTVTDSQKMKIYDIVKKNAVQVIPNTFIEQNFNKII